MSRLQKFMLGRYGSDQMNLALVVLAVFLALLAGIVKSPIIQAIGLALIIYALFRMLSKNVAARRKENNWFLHWSQPVTTKLGNFLTRRLAEHNDKEHRYFSCSTCRARLRVPKNRGTLQVTCPKCGRVTKVKS